MKIKRGLVPKAGYRFRDVDGVVHEGKGWGDLVRVVARYRAMRNLPAGDPQREITEAVCQADPKMCHNGPGELGEGDSNAFHLRVMDWLIRLLNAAKAKRVKFVNGIVAGERAEICRRCPYQQTFAKGCESCNHATGIIQQQIIKDQPQLGRDLFGCALLSEDTQVSIHLDESRLNNPTLPRHCWRRK